MTVNMELSLDLSVDDGPLPDDLSSIPADELGSGRRYLSEYICKGFSDSVTRDNDSGTNPNIPGNGLGSDHLIDRGDTYEWKPEVADGFEWVDSHPILARPRNVEAVTFESRKYQATGEDVRSRFEIEIPVVSDIEVALVAHLMVSPDLTEAQIEKLKDGMTGFSQNPDDDLQDYVVSFVASHPDVFGEDFSHESYIIDVGCILTKISEEVRYEAAKTLIDRFKVSILKEGNMEEASVKISEFPTTKTRKRISTPSGPTYNASGPEIEDETWNPEGEPSQATLDDLDDLIEGELTDFIDEELSQDRPGCDIVKERREKEKVATLLSWPQFKLVWVRRTFKVGCVKVSVRLPVLKRRTAFKVLYVAIATHFDVDDWLFDLLLKCALSAAVSASVVGLISANPAIAAAVFKSHFKTCVMDHIRREVFDCVSETIFVGTVHSGWKPV